MDRNRAIRGVCLGILLASTVVSVRGADLGDLSGTWKLNRDASDDPRKKMEEARDQSGGSGGGSGGGGGGSGMGGHHGGHRGGGRSGGDGSQSGGAFEPPSGVDELHIEHRDPKLVITDGAGREHVLYTDGRKIEEERSLGGTTKIYARWKDGHVVIETDPEHGATYTETYAVTADRKQLTVTLKLKARGRMPAMEIRKVYDAVTPAESPTPVPTSEDETQEAKQSAPRGVAGLVR
jgi:hypothetical protein